MVLTPMEKKYDCPITRTAGGARLDMGGLRFSPSAVSATACSKGGVRRAASSSNTSNTDTSLRCACTFQ